VHHQRRVGSGELGAQRVQAVRAAGDQDERAGARRGEAGERAADPRGGAGDEERRAIDFQGRPRSRIDTGVGLSATEKAVSAARIDMSVSFATR
jgi:hypothetical protein